EDADIALLVEDGRAVGYVICLFVEKPASPFSHASRVLYVDQIGVTESARGRGLGRVLMEHATACAERLRCDRIELDVAGFNDAALAFYRELGYAPWQYRLYRSVP